MIDNKYNKFDMELLNEFLHSINFKQDYFEIIEETPEQLNEQIES